MKTATIQKTVTDENGGDKANRVLQEIILPTTEQHQWIDGAEVNSGKNTTTRRSLIIYDLEQVEKELTPKASQGKKI